MTEFFTRRCAVAVLVSRTRQFFVGLRMFRLVVLLLLSPIAVVAEPKKVALVLGEQRYEHLRPLENPLNDALAVEARLQELGFEVFLETNRDLRRMRRALEDFVYDGEGADLALVFFAGHGLEVEGQNLLLPVDADPRDLGTLRDTALPLEEVVQALAQVAPRGIALIDACRSDPFGGSQDGTRAAAALSENVQVQPGFGRVGRADGLIYAFSAAPGRPALDGDAGNSPFSEALVRHISTPGLELRSVLTLVQQDVYDRTRGRQLPYIESGLAGVVFAAGRTDLPERDALLLAMASVSSEDRRAVERVARQSGMPLAPLYGALLQASVDGAEPQERTRRLELAARAYERLQARLLLLSDADPAVAEFRRKAQAAIDLGAVDEARELLQQAADVDATAREAQRDNLVARTVSQAETYALLAEAAAADLDYKAAIRDYKRALQTFAEARDLDRSGLITAGQASAAVGLAELYRLTGRPKRVLPLMESTISAVKLRLDEDNGDDGWQLLLAQLLVQRGNAAYAIRSNSSFDVALGSFWEAQPILERLLKVRAGDLELTLLLAQIHQKVSALARWVRDDAAAMQQLEMAAAVLSGASEAGSGNRRVAALLVELSYEAGDLDLEAGKVDRAAASYAQGLASAEALARAYPDDLTLLFDVWDAHRRLGELARRTNEVDAELDHYRKMAEIGRKLVAEDPQNFEWAWAQAAAQVGLASRADNPAPYIETALAVLASFEERSDLPVWQRDAIRDLQSQASAAR